MARNRPRRFRTQCKAIKHRIPHGTFKSMKAYIEAFTRDNCLKPSTFIINGERMEL